MRKKVPLITLDGKVIGNTENLSDTTTNPLGITTGWCHTATRVFDSDEFGRLSVAVGRFFTHNGGGWFEARTKHGSLLEYVLIKEGCYLSDVEGVEGIIEEAVRDWNSTWYEASQRILTSPKLTITIGDFYYGLDLKEVIDGRKVGCSYRLNRATEASLPEQWKRAVLRDLISKFYLGELSKLF